MTENWQSEIKELTVQAEQFIREYPSRIGTGQLEAAYDHFRIFFKTLHAIDDDVTAQEVLPTLKSLEQTLQDIVETAPGNALLYGCCLAYLHSSTGELFPRAIRGWAKQAFRNFGALWPEMLRSYIAGDHPVSEVIRDADRLLAGLLPAETDDRAWLQAVRACPMYPTVWTNVAFAISMHYGDGAADIKYLLDVGWRLRQVQGGELLD